MDGLTWASNKAAYEKLKLTSTLSAQHVGCAYELNSHSSISLFWKQPSKNFSTVLLYPDTIPPKFFQSFAAMLNSITCSQFLSFIPKGRRNEAWALSHDRSSLLPDRISKEIIEVLFWNWVNKLTNFSLSSFKVGVLKITQRLWWGTVIYW